MANPDEIDEESFQQQMVSINDETGDHYRTEYSINDTLGTNK